jgi:hypothetical protein
MLDSYGLPPMQQQSQGFVAQTVDEVMNIDPYLQTR